MIPKSADRYNQSETVKRLRVIIRAHPIYFNIQIVCLGLQQPYTLFRYIINTYIMHTFTLISCIITHIGEPGASCNKC